jgi:integrase
VRGKRTKLAPGVWQDAYGISIIVHTRHEYLEERHPLDTPLGKLNRRREVLRGEARGRALVAGGGHAQPARRRRTTLKDDVAVYLKAVAAMATLSERELQLSRWTAVFGDRPRQSIAPHEVQAQRDAWVTDKKSASWINHHLRALSNLFKVLDPDAPNPVRRVREVDEPDAIPRAIPHPVVAAIFEAMRPSQTRARLQVVATTGIEQSMFARLARADVDFDAATVRLPKRKKGQGASARVLPLTQAGVDAFKDIETWDAWGPYSTSAVYKSWRLACSKVERAHNKEHPKTPIDLSGLRPKDLRHTFGTELSLATGGNVATVQMFLAHETPLMADRYRMAAVPQHLLEAARLLELRVGTRKKTE